MEPAATHLMAAALETALVIALPMVATVAAVGILMSVAQTIVQIQDQNVSFLPKLVAIALLTAVAGVPGLALLVHLFITAAAAAAQLLAH